jgi:hypothetical protein
MRWVHQPGDHRSTTMQNIRNPNADDSSRDGMVLTVTQFSSSQPGSQPSVEMVGSDTRENTR